MYTVAQILIDKGVDKNRSTQSGATPLYIAAQCGHHIMVKLLIDKVCYLYLCLRACSLILINKNAETFEHSNRFFSFLFFSSFFYWLDRV